MIPCCRVAGGPPIRLTIAGVLSRRAQLTSGHDAVRATGKPRFIPITTSKEMRMKKPNLTRRRVVPILVVGGLIAGLAAGRHLLASDHQDTPEVELSPRFDVNDVYAFPAATPGRTVLVLGTSSPLTPANTPSFAFGTKDQELYQIKVDNTGDAVEDLVFQITFTGPAGHQRVTLRGPVKPNTTGPTNT